MNFIVLMNGQVCPVSDTGFFVIRQGANSDTFHYLWKELERDFDYWAEDWVYVGF